MSSRVTRYGGDFLEKLLRTYCVSPAGRHLGMSLLPWGLPQGLQRPGPSAVPDAFTADEVEP